jgi:TetR/AcrR family transcriptional regulator, tetracycline repressor protein
LTFQKERTVAAGSKKRTPGSKSRARRRPAAQPGRRSRRPRSTAPLAREIIVKTALAIVDRDGLKALSMRRLGAELGVDPMAVYYHLPSKQALLDAIVEAVMGSIDLTVDDPARCVEERILTAARVYRDALLGHINALPILLAHGPVTPVAMRPVELLIGILRDAGLPPAEALAGMNLIAVAVRGAVGMGAFNEASNKEFDAIWRAFSPAEFPRLAESLAASTATFEEFFDFGIGVLTRGLLDSARDRDHQP